MKFSLSEEQELLKDNVDRLIRADGRFTSTDVRRAPGAINRVTWTRFAELGLLELPFAEFDGVVGRGNAELMIVAEAIGRHLCLQPYVASIVLIGALLQFGTAARQRLTYAPGISDGTSLVALAHEEPQSRYDLADVVTTATHNGERWLINGRKCGVVAGGDADALIVSARVSGDRFDHNGIRLFWVDAAAPGISRRNYVALDDTRGAEIMLSDVQVANAARLDGLLDGFTVIERASDVAIAVSLAECVGIMEAMLQITIEYLKVRKQFGKKIGEFQVLQHRAADMLVAIEQARGMAIYANTMVEHEDADMRRKAVSAAKVCVGDSLRLVAANAVQLHGGMGVTEECAIGPYFKRAAMLEMFLGDVDHHLSLFSKTDGLTQLSQDRSKET